jgi:hypothetical protein
MALSVVSSRRFPLLTQKMCLQQLKRFRHCEISRTAGRIVPLLRDPRGPQYAPKPCFASLLVRDRDVAQSLEQGFEGLWRKAMKSLQEINFDPRRPASDSGDYPRATSHGGNSTW